jgi:predicted nucleotidyltransferase
MNLQRLEMIAKRLYEDSFYRTMFSYALDICKEITQHDKNNLIYFTCIRGSLVTGTITESEDIDILINSKRTRKFKKLVKRIGEKYNCELKEILPQLKRADVVSIYMLETPRNPCERYKFFVEDPVELEIRTTQAEQSLPREKRRIVYKFQKCELKNVVDSALKDPFADCIQISENIRKIAMHKYCLDRDTAHNSTIICQARLVGLIFSRERIQKNYLIEKRNRIVEEVFPDKLSEIKYLMDKVSVK